MCMVFKEIQKIRSGIGMVGAVYPDLAVRVE
jgi:hypothetical protein